MSASGNYKPSIPDPDPAAAGEDGFGLPGSGRGVSAGIARSSFGLTLTMGVVALAELGREIVVARLFGAGPASDAYYLGIAVPLVLRGAMLTVGGQVVLPWLCLSSRGDAEVSHRYASQLVFLLCWPLLLLALGSGWLAATIAPWIAGPAIQRPLLVQVLTWALPALVLGAQTAVLMAYLHSRELYSGAALHTLAGSMVFAGGLVLLRGLPAERSLGTAFLAGNVAELAWLAILARPTPVALRSWRNLPWRPFKDLLRRSALPTAAVVLRQLGLAAERILAGYLGVGAVAILSYSNRMALGVGKIFTEAMHTVVRSKTSRAQARGAGAEMAEILSQGSRQMLLLLLPIATCMVVLRVPISRVLFESGEFSTGALVTTAAVFAAYAAALPAYGVSPALMTGFYAAGEVITPSLHQLLMLAANLALDLLFVRWWGVLGIGVAFVATLMLSVLRAGWLVERRLVRLSLWHDARYFAALLLGVACCVGATWGAWGLLRGLAVHGRLALASVTALAGLAGVAAFAVVQMALGVAELRMLLRWLRARMQSLRRRPGLTSAPFAPYNAGHYPREITSMRKLDSMKPFWAFALYALADTLCAGMGMGVPIFNIAFGFVVGWIVAGRARAEAQDLHAALRKSLRYALLTSAWTLLLMLIIWGPFTLKLFDPSVDLAQTGIPLILYDPRASFIGWQVLMMLISPFLQLFTTVFAAALHLATQK